MRTWIFNHYSLIEYGLSAIGFLLPLTFLLLPTFVNLMALIGLLFLIAIYLIIFRHKVSSYLLKIKLLREGDTVLYDYGSNIRKGVFIPLDDFFLQKERQEITKSDIQLLGKTRIFIKDKEDQKYYFPGIRRVIKIYDTLSL